MVLCVLSEVVEFAVLVVAVKVDSSSAECKTFRDIVLDFRSNHEFLAFKAVDSLNFCREFFVEPFVREKHDELVSGIFVV